MMRSALLACLVAITRLQAQDHVFGFVGGLTASASTRADGFVTASPDLGVSSIIEPSHRIAFGLEGRILSKTPTPSLDLVYLETPLFVRLSPVAVTRKTQPFVRAGIAPAIALRCSAINTTTNHPETARVVADPVGFTYHKFLRRPNLQRQEACAKALGRHTDFGVLAGIGTVKRVGLREYSIELRFTQGTVGLGNSAYNPDSPRNRTLALLTTFASRWM